MTFVDLSRPDSRSILANVSDERIHEKLAAAFGSEANATHISVKGEPWIENTQGKGRYLSDREMTDLVVALAIN
jgi:hypothetical protein